MRSLLGVCTIGSVLLGLTAWVLPLARKGRQGYRTALSLGCCTLSLGIQVLHVWLRVRLGDFSGLEDTWKAVALAAVVLVAGTLLSCGLGLLAAWLRARRAHGI